MPSLRDEYLENSQAEYGAPDAKESGCVPVNYLHYSESIHTHPMFIYCRCMDASRKMICHINCY